MRPAFVIALAVVALTFALFCLNYWVLAGTLPGYRLLAYPGIVTTRLFSEEIAFWPKLAILLSGQFVAYFAAALTFTTLRHHRSTR